MTYCLPIPVHGSAPTEQGQASRSTANQLIVFGVGADPDPFHDAGLQEAERPVNGLRSALSPNSRDSPAAGIAVKGGSDCAAKAGRS